MPAGQPTKYNKEYHPKLAKAFSLLGLTDKQIAEELEVTETTINNWKKKHPEFFESLKAGKKVADCDVAKSLYERACGYSHPEDKVFMHSGEPVIVPTTKHYPPDTVSMIFWLKNRQPELWRDKREVQATGDEGLAGLLAEIADKLPD